MTRVNWERVGRISLVLIVFVILALYVNPIVNFVDAWRDARSEKQTLVDLKVENQGLQERAAALTEPDASERGARRLGMVAPGERSVVICSKSGPPGCQQ